MFGQSSYSLPHKNSYYNMVHVATWFYVSFLIQNVIVCWCQLYDIKWHYTLLKLFVFTIILPFHIQNPYAILHCEHSDLQRDFGFLYLMQSCLLNVFAMVLKVRNVIRISCLCFLDQILIFVLFHPSLVIIVINRVDVKSPCGHCSIWSTGLYANSFSMYHPSADIYHWSTTSGH